MQDKVVKQSRCNRQFIGKVVAIINIITAVIVVSFGVYKYAEGDIKSFGNIFIPAYLILFGLLLICAEVEWLYLVKYFKFLDNYFGRCIYNVFLSTIVANNLTEQFSNFQSSTSTQIFALTLACVLIAIGITYLTMYIITCGEKSEKYSQYDLTLEDSLNPKITAQTVNSENAKELDQLMEDKNEYTQWLKAQQILYQK